MSTPLLLQACTLHMTRKQPAWVSDHSSQLPTGFKLLVGHRPWASSFHRQNPHFPPQVMRWDMPWASPTLSQRISRTAITPTRPPENTVTLGTLCRMSTAIQTQHETMPGQHRVVSFITLNGEMVMPVPLSFPCIPDKVIGDQA